MTEENSQYRPLFLEELFVVHLYGSDEELSRFHKLMENKENFENVVAIAALIEDIKRKNLTKLNWFCCSKCQNYKICRINWYRGEKNIERNCCTYCQHYDNCYDNFRTGGKKASEKTVENPLKSLGPMDNEIAKGPEKDGDDPLKGADSGDNEMAKGPEKDGDDPLKGADSGDNEMAKGPEKKGDIPLNVTVKADDKEDKKDDFPC